MSAEVTDADRVAAHSLFVAARADHNHLYAEQRIAQALADQRAAADDGLRARVEALFEGGPDTVCRTTWRREAGWSLPGASVPLTECVEVPLDALRAALDPPTATHCTARHDVHEDGVTATWSCQQLGAHGTHKDSIGREWNA